jgi:hypothetical protein
MKKIMLALAFIGIAGLSSSFANAPVDVNRKAAAAFHADFHMAKNVNWIEAPKYVKAQFNLDNKVMFAYYNSDGNFICLIRNILTTELPSYLRNNIKKNYSSYWVSELFQLSTDQGTSYYIQLENGDGSMVLCSENEGEWRPYNDLEDPSAKQTVKL